MRLTSYFSSSVSFSVLSLSVLALSGLSFAAPVSQDGNTLVRREDCEYGERITLDEYVSYLKEYYPATDHYLLYSAGSRQQVVNFKNLNTGYYYYEDFFNSDVSEHYLTKWPQDENGCYRPDDGEASSIAIAKVASGDVLVFGAVEYQEKGQTSFFATKEVPELRTNIRNGQLSKITHMLRDATQPSEVLATEDADGAQTFAEGHSKGESNASGTFGDCTSTLDPPTCDIPSAGN